MSILKNGIYQSDCLILLERLPNQSIDLVYIDPPWNTPNQLNKNTDSEYIRFMRRVIRQFRRVLSSKGNLLIHITPETGLYIRPLMDEIFDRTSYRPEISIPIKHRREVIPQKSRAAHEIILHYAISTESTYNRLTRPKTKKEAIQEGYENDENGKLFRKVSLLSPLSEVQRPSLHYEFRGYLRTWKYSLPRLLQLEAEGRIYQANPQAIPHQKSYLEEAPDVDITDDWQNIPLIEYSRKNSSFDGQRPIVLMDKLINIASNRGDVVLDVFCGSGSTLISAENLGRRWIDCDNLGDAYSLAKNRLENEAGVKFDTAYVNGDDLYLQSNFAVVRNSAIAKVFISYSRRDEEEFVTPFCAKLEDEMLDYWKDKRDIEVGDQWKEKLLQGLDECEAMVLFISPNSLDSEYVQEEYTAFLNTGKPIYSLVCKETHIPKDLKKFQYLYYSDHEKVIEKLRTFPWKA